MAGDAAQQFKVRHGDVELRISLTPEWQSRPFRHAVVHPFVKSWNRRAATTGAVLLSEEALAGVLVDGIAAAAAAEEVTSTVAPPGVARVELLFGDPPPAQMVLRIRSGDTSIKVTLDRKWMRRSFSSAVVVPLLSVRNRDLSGGQPSIAVATLQQVDVDGVPTLQGRSACEAAANTPALQVLGATASQVELYFSLEEVRSAAMRAASPQGLHALPRMSEADYAQAKELCWELKGLNPADGELLGRELIAAAPLKQLHYVFLQRNELRDVGVVAIAKALTRERAPELRALHLQSNSITSKGVVDLIRELNESPELKVLSLHDNLLCDKGVLALAAAVSSGALVAKRISVYGNRSVSANACRQLLDACEGCCVVEAPVAGCGPTPYIPLEMTPQRWANRDS